MNAYDNLQEIAMDKKVSATSWDRRGRSVRDDPTESWGHDWLANLVEPGYRPSGRCMEEERFCRALFGNCRYWSHAAIEHHEAMERIAAEMRHMPDESPHVKEMRARMEEAQQTRRDEQTIVGMRRR